MTTAAATVERLAHEIERRRIRAPMAGRLREIAELRIGSVVREGDRLAAVVPWGELQVVADFLPPSALGRIRVGQSARLRLEGFPWTQYGSLAATVRRVASEVRNGRVRVELSLDPDHASPIPLQHGLPGSVEVQVERLAPATLVLRAAGKLLARPVAGGQGERRPDE
jgi:membrane fusion protein (multidrug efflux system)